MKKSAFFGILALIFVFVPLVASYNKKSAELEKIDEKQIETTLKLERWKAIDAPQKIAKIKKTQMSRILSIAKKKAISPNIIAGIMTVESGGNVKAIGKNGDKGLMQLRTPAAQTVNASEICLKDPDCNVLKGAEYLKYLRSQGFNNLPEILLAYNIGETRARELLRGGLNPNDSLYVKKVSYAINEFASSN